jgi:small subunit ribosomal protein S15
MLQKKSEALMAVSKETRAEILAKFARSRNDTGSSEVQIALLTERIKEMSKHFEIHKKDYHSVTGLMRAVSQRRKLLDYLKRNSFERYQKLIDQLQIRK